jgi:hypothetical protein
MSEREEEADAERPFAFLDKEAAVSSIAEM